MMMEYFQQELKYHFLVIDLIYQIIQPNRKPRLTTAAPAGVLPALSKAGRISDQMDAAYPL